MYDKIWVICFGNAPLWPVQQISNIIINNIIGFCIYTVIYRKQKISTGYQASVSSLTCGKGGWGAMYPLFRQNLSNKMVSAEALLKGFLGVYIDGIFCPYSSTAACKSASLY